MKKLAEYELWVVQIAEGYKWRIVVCDDEKNADALVNQWELAGKDVDKWEL